MKSNKSTMYLLLAAVLFVWTWIGVKIFKSIKGNRNQSVATVQVAKNQGQVIDRSFELALSYNDPFGKLAQAKVKIDQKGGTTLQPQSKKEKNRKEIVKDIKYLGLIKSGEVQTGLVNIDGEEFAIREGEIVQGFIVGKMTKFKLEIIVDDSKKVFTLF